VRLINTGLGEFSDRLSILALKILHGDERGSETAHWKTERNALIAKLGARALNANWVEAYIELAAVNAAIWRGEDELRAYRAQHVEVVADPRELRALTTAVQIAFNLQMWNDRRHELIEAINKDGGDFLGQEKL